MGRRRRRQLANSLARLLTRAYGWVIPQIDHKVSVQEFVLASGWPSQQGAMPFQTTRLEPDATTWVAKDKATGELVRLPVRAMSDAHLWRWIRYFRNKWRNSGFVGSDTELDLVIQAAMVTAPAIYTEAAKRGVIQGKPLQADKIERKPASPERLIEPGRRMVTFDD